MKAALVLDLYRAARAAGLSRKRAREIAQRIIRDIYHTALRG